VNKTNIEYLDYTWNPIVMRCTPVSEGCTNCWHLATAGRLAKNPKIPLGLRVIYEKGCISATPPYREDSPFRKGGPYRIGVQFMGDLFHESLLFDVIQDVFETILFELHHRFLLLTKRPQIALRFLTWVIELHGGEICHLAYNMWMGVSGENQARADERIPILLQIPARIRWVSLEPLLGPIQILDNLSPDKINWVVIGPETGPKRRPCDPAWIEDLVRQCEAACIPYFVKAFPMPDGRISKDMIEWPEWAQVRQYPA
jgi:protein gp37